MPALSNGRLTEPVATPPSPRCEWSEDCSTAPVRLGLVIDDLVIPVRLCPAHAAALMTEVDRVRAAYGADMAVSVSDEAFEVVLTAILRSLVQP